MQISRRVHGIFDYLFSIIVATSPWVFGFSHEYMAPQIAVICGAVTAMYSIMTDYECGVLRFIPFAGHRFFDMVVAVTLGGAAWHFSMAGRAPWVFGLLGAIAFAVTFLTRRPSDAGTVAH
jgi:hypothetical protein